MNCKDCNEKSFGFAFRKVNLLMKRRIENSRVRKELDDCTGTHGYVICCISEHKGEDFFQKDLEKRFSIRRSTATAMLQLMEKNGLIQRLPVPQDARLKKIILTPKAEEMVQLLNKEKNHTERVMLNGFSEQETEQLFGFLERVQNNLKNDFSCGTGENKCKN